MNEIETNLVINESDSFKDVLYKINHTFGEKIQNLNFGMEKLLKNGIYIVKENNTIIYIGKATSRTFLERLAGHFDVREAGGFNNVIKKISKDLGYKEYSADGLLEAWKKANQFNIIFLEFNQTSSMIPMWEKRLIEHFLPLYNNIWALSEYGLQQGQIVLVTGLSKSKSRKVKVTKASFKRDHVKGHLINEKSGSLQKTEVNFHMNQIIKIIEEPTRHF
ncbi:GIY-YIG nuclease family protein [Robertmurraya korlensis]|uniref:GIY-YIG nuclease family protein n=1 Tax=Robertmurraya korlensis TaxID=519977 RepID=UPI000824D30A|nr:GIY-YIG nuclease family protein [Robertmurraya korlensis]